MNTLTHRKGQGVQCSNEKRTTYLVLKDAFRWTPYTLILQNLLTINFAIVKSPFLQVISITLAPFVSSCAFYYLTLKVDALNETHAKSSCFGSICTIHVEKRTQIKRVKFVNAKCDGDPPISFE